MNDQFIGLMAITVVAGNVHRSTIIAIVGDDIDATATLASGISVPLQRILVLQ